MDKKQSYSLNSQSISRRNIIKAMGMGAATAAFVPLALNTQSVQSQTNQNPVNQSQTHQNPVAQSGANQTSDMIMKPIPRTNEMVPAIGMGTFLTFDVLENQPRDHIREVMRRFWEGGGRMIDVSPLYGMSEVNVGEFASALGITNDLFITSKIWATGQYLGDRSQAMQQFEQSLQRLSRDRIDLMQVHTLVNVDIILPLIKELKQEGRVRYAGVTHHEMPLSLFCHPGWVIIGAKP